MLQVSRYDQKWQVRSQGKVFTLNGRHAISFVAARHDHDVVLFFEDGPITIQEVK